MTPQRGEAGRGLGASRDEAPPPSGILAALILGALLLRLAIVYAFPGAGFKVDIGSFQSWAITLARHGPGGFYENAGFADYTPGYLYLLWLVGLASQALGDLTGSSSFVFAGALIKVPAIVFDLATGYLIYRAVRPWNGERVALIGATLYLFNPVTWYDSALWGQVDSVGVFVLLAAILLLVAGWSEAATGAAVLAAVIKPQLGIGVLIVGFVLLGHHLLRPGSGPRPVPRNRVSQWIDGLVGGWFTDEQGPWRLVSSAAVGMAVLFLLITPFDLAELAATKAPWLPIGGDLGGLLVVVGQAVGEYHFLTVNAHNLWALVGPTSLAWTGLWTSDLEPALSGLPIVGNVPYGAIGSFLLLITVTSLGYRFLRAKDRSTIIVTATVLAVAFFVVPTRVHERYLFPAFALGALLAGPSPTWRWWYVALALVNVANLHANLTNPLYGTDNVIDLPLGEFLRSGIAVTFVAVVHTALFGWAFLRMHRGEVAVPSGQEAARPGATALTDGLSPAGAAGPPAEARSWELVPAGGWLEALGRRVRSPSVRADRSRLLHGEGPGRLDRLDLLVLVLVVVLGLSLRLYRADQPVEMITLDEVYHARTATEFLQEWRYGTDHAIYEWTHPHLAKYLMALGIEALGDNHVVGTSSLGAPVRSAVIEPAYTSDFDPQARAGGRLFVATGTSLRVLDLASRNDEATLPVPAAALALDGEDHRLYIGSADGLIRSLDTSGLDMVRAGEAEPEDLQPTDLARLDGEIERLWSVGTDGVVAQSGGTLVALDAASGEVLARRAIGDLGGAATLDVVTAVVAYPAQMSDLTGEVDRLAQLLDVAAAELARRLGPSQGGEAGGVTIAGYLSADEQSAVQAALDDGELPGVEITQRTPLAFGSANGVTLLDGTSLDTIGEVGLEAAGGGLAIAGKGNDRALYVAAADEAVYVLTLQNDALPTRRDRLQMPGPVRDVRWNDATNLVHVLGETAEGSPTVYVVEPHAVAVFADAVLPFSSVAWALDIQPDFPHTDRQQALVFSADGAVAAIDIGHNAFAWRFAGVVLGVLTAAALYLLARFLFRRRSIALIAAVAALTDGMLFAHSRDAMNDAYAGFFIVAAFAALAWLWVPGVRRDLVAIALGLPLVGLLLGLGLASKWVAAFAIGAAVLLVLLRSASGRLVALGGMVVLSGLLGHLGVASGNLTFALIMVGLTVLLGAGIASRPMTLSREEVRTGVVALLASAALVAVASVGGLLPEAQLAMVGIEVPVATAVAIGLVVAALGVWLVGGMFVGDRVAGAASAADAGPTAAWLRPGAAWGIPFAYALLCLAVLPLVVYVASYVPWARPWDPYCPPAANDCPVILPASVAADGTTLAEGWPPGHRGQTLLNLTVSMYDYHNDLRATHPATSPWWTWPFDLKPVWLWQGSYGEGTQAVVFDLGNLVTWWLAVPAIGFGLWQAWRRQSLALGFVAVVFLALWLNWARIDRAAFLYHFYTALPFAFLFLAYFLAELWHGSSRRTWLLARAATALAILFPGLLWLVKDPLCTVAGVQSVDPSSYLCTGASGSFDIPWAIVATGVALLVGLGLMAWEFLRLEVEEIGRVTLLRLGLFALATAVAVTLAPRLAGSESFTIQGNVGQTWLVGAVYLIGATPLVWLALGLRDPRRFVAIALVAAATWLVLFYPYIAALPLPGGSVYVYQRLLPTFDYSFQFAVNQAPSPDVSVLDTQALVLTVSIAVLVGVGMLLVAQWRADRMGGPPTDSLSGSPADGREPVRP